jgi:hypothetical protein
MLVIQPALNSNHSHGRPRSTLRGRHTTLIERCRDGAGRLAGKLFKDRRAYGRGPRDAQTCASPQRLSAFLGLVAVLNALCIQAAQLHALSLLGRQSVFGTPGDHRTLFLRERVAGRELPAYLSNGVVGLKVRYNPLSPGMTLLSGFSGEHPERKIEAAAFAPYPIAGDVSLDGVWMSETSQNVRIIDQACDFSTGELTTRLTFHAGGHQAKIAVMAFCSRDQPTLVCQEISVEVDGACDIRVRATIDLSGIEGRALRYNRDTPGEVKPSSDGSLLWESAGAMSTCGLAYVTELLGDEAKPQRLPLDGEGLRSEYAWRAHSN